MDGKQLAALLFVAFGASLLLLVNRYARGRRANGKGGDVIRTDSSQTQIRTSVDRLMVELQEASREMTGKLDTRIRILNQLVQDADDRIAQLTRIAGERASGQKESVPDGSLAGAVPELHQTIHRLRDEGKSVMEISQETELPPGEIELILRMRPERERTA